MKNKLGPGWRSAGGPRMDRQAVTSFGVVKLSRVASCLRRLARRGPHPSAVLIKLFMICCPVAQARVPYDPKCHAHGAPTDLFDV